MIFFLKFLLSMITMSFHLTFLCFGYDMSVNLSVVLSHRCKLTVLLNIDSNNNLVFSIQLGKYCLGNWRLYLRQSLYVLSICFASFLNRFI